MNKYPTTCDLPDFVKDALKYALNCGMWLNDPGQVSFVSHWIGRPLRLVFQTSSNLVLPRQIDGDDSNFAICFSKLFCKLKNTQQRRTAYRWKHPIDHGFTEARTSQHLRSFLAQNSNVQLHYLLVSVHFLGRSSIFHFVVHNGRYRYSKFEHARWRYNFLETFQSRLWL